MKTLFFNTLLGKNIESKIETLEKTQWLSRDELSELQLIKLRNIIAHAYLNTQYFKNKLDELDILPTDIKSYQDLKHIPPMTKMEIKKTLHSELMSKKRFIYTVKGTSGSTGIPIKFFVDRDANAWHLAAMHRYRNWNQIQIGDREIRLWGRLDTKMFYPVMKDFFLNRRVLSRIDKANIESAVKLVKRFKPLYLYGYPSMLISFAKVWKDYNLGEFVKLKAVISTAEMIYEHQKKYLNTIFKAPVVDEYGCQESGIIAYECEHGNKHISSENLYVEILPDNNTGESGRILITDLHNKMMPLIRYELGDLIELNQNKCVCGRGLPLLQSVVGRKIEFIKFDDGTEVHPVFLQYLIRELSFKGLDILNFKILQKDLHSIKIKLIPAEPSKVNDNELRGIANVMEEKYLGNKIKVIFKVVDEIASDAQSGKLSYFQTYLNN